MVLGKFSRIHIGVACCTVGTRNGSILINRLNVHGTYTCCAAREWTAYTQVVCLIIPLGKGIPGVLHTLFQYLDSTSFIGMMKEQDGDHVGVEVAV
jgi:hypothetical protein